MIQTLDGVPAKTVDADAILGLSVAIPAGLDTRLDQKEYGLKEKEKLRGWQNE